MTNRKHHRILNADRKFFLKKISFLKETFEKYTVFNDILVGGVDINLEDRKSFIIFC